MGLSPDEAETIARNSVDTMGGLYALDPRRTDPRGRGRDLPRQFRGGSSRGRARPAAPAGGARSMRTCRPGGGSCRREPPPSPRPLRCSKRTPSSSSAGLQMGKSVPEKGSVPAPRGRSPPAACPSGRDRCPTGRDGRSGGGQGDRTVPESPPDPRWDARPRWPAPGSRRDSRSISPRSKGLEIHGHSQILGQIQDLAHAGTVVAAVSAHVGPPVRQSSARPRRAGRSSGGAGLLREDGIAPSRPAHRNRPKISRKASISRFRPSRSATVGVGVGRMGTPHHWPIPARCSSAANASGVSVPGKPRRVRRRPQKGHERGNRRRAEDRQA